MSSGRGWRWWSSGGGERRLTCLGLGLGFFSGGEDGHSTSE